MNYNLNYAIIRGAIQPTSKLNYFDTEELDKFDQKHKDKLIEIYYYNEVKKPIQKIEYEYFGDNKKQKRIVNVIYYGKDDENQKYYETFKYKNIDKASPTEKSFSKLYKFENNSNETIKEEDSKNLIGYRFYNGGYDIKDVEYFTVYKETDPKNNDKIFYGIVEAGENYKNNSKYTLMMENIIKNSFISDQAYEIGGNLTIAIGLYTALKVSDNNMPLFFNNCEAINQKVQNKQGEKKQKYFSKKNNLDDEIIELIKRDLNVKQNEFLMPLLINYHSSLLLFSENESDGIKAISKTFLIDSSLSHTKKTFDENGKNKRVIKRDIFGDKLTKITELINEKTIQVGECCLFWSYSFAKLINSQYKNNESLDIEKIIKNSKSGLLQLEAALKFSDMFEGEEKTIKMFENNSDIENNEYVTFKFNNNIYGIKRNSYNNKFLNLAGIASILEKNKEIKYENLKEQLKTEIYLQKELKPIQKQIRTYYNIINLLERKSVSLESDIAKVTVDIKNGEWKELYDFLKKDLKFLNDEINVIKIPKVRSLVKQEEKITEQLIVVKQEQNIKNDKITFEDDFDTIKKNVKALNDYVEKSRLSEYSVLMESIIEETDDYNKEKKKKNINIEYSEDTSTEDTDEIYLDTEDKILSSLESKIKNNFNFEKNNSLQGIAFENLAEEDRTLKN